MDIYQALTKDHNQIKPLLDQLVAVSVVDESSKQILDRIGEELIPHARAEEAVFYNSLRGIEGVENVVGKSFNEHAEAEQVLRKIQGMDTVDAEWTATTTKLRSALLHHISFEEGKVFAEARQVLFEEESQQLGAAFEQAKLKAKEQGDMKNTMDAIANLMPQRFADRVRGFTTPPA